MPPVDLIRSETKRQLLELMKRRGEITLDDAMEEIDRARPTLRDHLDQMGRDGLVARRTQKQGRGRPSMCYRLTSRADCLFPQQEGVVLGDFLIYLEEQDQEHLIEDFFDSFWDARLDDVEHRLPTSLDAADARQTVDALENVLREKGFMPEVRADDGHLTVEACNCPFATLVNATDVPCSTEAYVFETLFERADRTCHMPDGDPTCVYELPVVQQ